LESRGRGRPTVATEELRQQILLALCEGVPLRAICRRSGMPSRRTIYNWRSADPVFRQQFDFAGQEGQAERCLSLVDEVDRLLKAGRDPRLVALVFRIKAHEIDRINGTRGFPVKR